MRQNRPRLSNKLEKSRAAARRAAGAGEDPEPARGKLREYLRAHGIEQQPEESLAETTARAFGIDCNELRNQLRARACA